VLQIEMETIKQMSYDTKKSEISQMLQFSTNDTAVDVINHTPIYLPVITPHVISVGNTIGTSDPTIIDILERQHLQKDISLEDPIQRDSIDALDPDIIDMLEQKYIPKIQLSEYKQLFAIH
jgi:hypothetical protein